jgi:glycosyltransferase involved in cell wall biosynthesis
MTLAMTFATDGRVKREARALADRGFRVQILSWDREGLRPQRETIDQCLVRNIRFGKTSLLPHHRIHYAIAAILLQLIIFLVVFKEVRRSRKLVLHAHDFNTLLGCAAARQLLNDRVRLVYDCHELTPGIYQEWYGSFVSRIVGRLEFMALRRVDAIVAANEAICRHLRRASSTPAAVVHNSPATRDVPMIESLDAKKKLGLNGFFVVLFTGKLRQDYDLDVILDAARDLKRSNLSDVKFVFIGLPETKTMPALFNAASREGLQHLFDFRGWVSDEHWLTYYIASDLCFAVTRDLGPNTKILTPNKLFESMACGVPVVVRVGTLAAEIVQRWRCGIVLDPARTSLSAEIMALRQDPEMLRSYGDAGREAFNLAYNWDLMQVRLFQLYAEL